MNKDVKRTMQRVTERETGRYRDRETDTKAETQRESEPDRDREPQNEERLSEFGKLVLAKNQKWPKLSSKNLTNPFMNRNMK